MISKYHSFLPEKNALGPQNNEPAAPTTSNSRKGQRGGWATSTEKATHDHPGKDSPGWVCNTNKSTGIAAPGYGPTSSERIISSTKAQTATGWIISSKKTGTGGKTLSSRKAGV